MNDDSYINTVPAVAVLIAKPATDALPIAEAQARFAEIIEQHRTELEAGGVLIFKFPPTADPAALEKLAISHEGQEHDYHISREHNPMRGTEFIVTIPTEETEREGYAFFEEYGHIQPPSQETIRKQWADWMNYLGGESDENNPVS